jgi:flagella basal body P-ring formation protein FlgA
MIPILMLVAASAACHAVNGDRITGADLAAVSPAFADLAREIVIGYAPQPGAHRTLEPAELIRIATANGIEVGNLTSGVLTSICFERFLVPLDNSHLLSALRESLNRPDAEIEVLEFSKFLVPPGKIVFPLETLPARSSANVAIWNGYVEFEGKHLPIWARARISVPQTRVVAAVPLRAGQTIAAGDVRVEDVREFPAKMEPLKSVAECLSHLARRFIDTGVAITAADLTDANDVDRGDTVVVEVQSGGTVLQLEAQAEMSGRRGQLIPLRNTTSGKTFRARIVGKDKTLLDFPSPENK